MARWVEEFCWWGGGDTRSDNSFHFGKLCLRSQVIIYSTHGDLERGKKFVLESPFYVLHYSLVGQHGAGSFIEVESDSDRGNRS